MHMAAAGNATDAPTMILVAIKIVRRPIKMTMNMTRTNVAPDDYADLDVPCPYNGVDAVYEVDHKEPSDERQDSYITSTPVRREGYQNEDCSNESASRERRRHCSGDQDSAAPVLK